MVWPDLWGGKRDPLLLYAWRDAVRFAVCYDGMLWSTLVLRGECVARFMGRECGLHLLCAWGDAVRFPVVHFGSTGRVCGPLYGERMRSAFAVCMGRCCSLSCFHDVLGDVVRFAVFMTY